MRHSFAVWSKALALIESGDQPNPQPPGDGGRSAWRHQLHPAFVAQWYRPPHGTDDTWDEADARAVEAFWMAAEKVGQDDVVAAVGFHLHGQIHASAADMASPDGRHYAKLFADSLAIVIGETPGG